MTIARVSFQNLTLLHGDADRAARTAALRRIVILNIDQPRLIHAISCRWLVDGPLPAGLDAFLRSYLHASTVGDSRLMAFAAFELARRSRAGAEPPFLSADDERASPLAATVSTALQVMTGERDADDAARPRNVHFGPVNWIFGELNGLAMAIGLREAAARLFALWGQWEDASRRAARAIDLHPNFLENIGHAAIVKAFQIAQAAGDLPDRPLITTEPPAPHNHILYDLLRREIGTVPPALPTHFEVIRGHKPYRLSDGRVLATPALISEAVHRHMAGGAAAALPLEPTVVAAAKRHLAAAGIDADRPFVTLHVREPGFDPGSVRTTRTRNAAIGTYLPAMRRLVAAGFQVIRMGDTSMARLPSMDGVVDYPFSTAKSPEADLFLVATCRFHVGTSSGLSLLPILFDRPVLFTNWVPIGDEVWSRRSLFIYKRFRRLDGRPVSLAEARRRFAALYRLEHLMAAGAWVEDNTPGEIAAAVDDMLAFVAAGGEIADTDGPAVAPSFRD